MTESGPNVFETCFVESMNCVIVTHVTLTSGATRQRQLSLPCPHIQPAKEISDVIFVYAHIKGVTGSTVCVCIKGIDVSSVFVPVSFQGKGARHGIGQRAHPGLLRSRWSRQVARCGGVFESDPGGAVHSSPPDGC